MVFTSLRACAGDFKQETLILYELYFYLAMEEEVALKEQPSLEELLSTQ